jgi:predicted alpha-1,2-mannosidase
MTSPSPRSAALRAWLVAPAIVGSLLAATLAAAPAAPALAVSPASSAKAADAAARDVSKYVDPFMSTEDDFGQDIPGAYVPNGIVKANPMTAPDRSHTGYDYAQSKISGFTLSNLDGAGGSGGGGDVLVVPTTADYTARPGTNTYAKTFSHDDETAEPGYYQVGLSTDEGTIDAEMTAEVRTAIESFTFPTDGEASLVVDLKNNFTSRISSSLEVTKLDDGRVALAGDVVGSFNNAKYRLYYYAQSTQAVTSVQTWGDSGTLSAATHRSGVDTGAILTFDAKAGEPVELRATLSPISAEQAAIDQGVEVDGRNFGDIRTAATETWNETLGQVDVTNSATSDPDGELIRLFYTSLYRMLATPVNATSTDGQWRGLDGVIYTAEGYTHYDSWYTWDDFRKFSVLAYLYPDRYGDMAQSLVDLFATGARAGTSTLLNLTHSVPTCRFERSAIVIADAISKGYELDGLEDAWPALVREADTYSDADEERGYVASNPGTTVGTSYDDYGLSVIADALGKKAEAASYRDKAGNFVNSIKADAWTAADGTEVGVLTPRTAEGTFTSTDLEKFEAAGLYQGTLWQYNWYPANDMAGLIEEMGGTKAAQLALSHMFGEEAPDDGSRMLHSNANEIDLQAPYLFNYVGQPSKTQKWVRNIYTKETWNRYIATGSTGEVPSGGGEFTPPVKTKVYSLDPQGLLPTMDDDAGTMSTMFVAAAMGLFPVTAGSDQYQIGTPFFDRVRVSYADGGDFTVTADGVSPDDYYIQSAKLDGSALDNTWVEYSDVVDGGSLGFEMGDEASDWGSASSAPFSQSIAEAGIPGDASDPIQVSGTTFEESAANDGSVDPITLTVTGASIVGSVGDDLAASGLVSASGLPAGMGFAAVKTANASLELRLTGTATSHLDSDDVEGIAVTIKDAAFSGGLTTKNKSLTFGADFRGLSITSSSSSLSADAAGVVGGSITMTLRGGGAFAGSDGADLTASGAAKLVGLADGVSGTVTRSSSTELTVAVSGTLAEVKESRFTVKLAASAFEGSVDPSEVNGEGLSSRSPFRILVSDRLHQLLAADVAEARLIVRSNYTATSFTALESTRDAARTVLADDAATDDEIRLVRARLAAAVDGLTLSEGGFSRLEAEQADELNGPGREASNIGGVRPGGWVAFTDLDFAGGDVPDGIQVRYTGAADDGYTDAFVEVHADAADGPLVATVQTPPTGSNFSTYATASAEVTDVDALMGAKKLYFVFGGTVKSGLGQWVGNFDWFQFTSSEAAAEPLTLQPNAVTTTIPATDPAYNAGVTTSNNLFENTHNGEWGEWAGVDFGSGVDTLAVRYDKPTGRTTPDASLDLYIDDMTGSPAQSVALPQTGSSWGTYATATIALDDPDLFSGVHDVYVVFRAPSATDSNPYVGNIGEFSFSQVSADSDSYVLEAENWSAIPTGSALKKETGSWNDGTITDVGGTANGDWLQYDDVDFGDRDVASVSVHYVHNSSRCGTDSRIDVYLDSRDGEPVTSVPLPSTGSNWTTAGRATVAMPAGVTGMHDVYLELHTTAYDGHPYVANIDNLEFRYGVDKSALRSLVNQTAPLLDERERFVTADVATFETVLDAADAVLDDELAGASDVSTATRRLRLGAGLLEPRAQRLLLADVSDAEATDTTPYTDETVATLREALAAATAVLDDADATDAEYTAATTELAAAVAALDEKATSVPGAPATLSATVDQRTVTVRWTAGPDGGSAITGWIVTLDGRDPVTIDDSATTEYVFTGLTRGRDYGVSVRAVNANGTSEAAVQSVTIPMPTLAPSTPDRPTASVIGTSVTVAWAAPEDGNSPITGYRVKLDGAEPVTVFAGDREHTFIGVAAGEHTATVAAVNGVGESAYSSASNTVTVQAPVAAPQPSVSKVTATSAQISWSAAATGNSVYVITVRHGASVVKQALAPAGSTSVTVSGLSPKTAYTAEIQVLGAGGGATSAPQAFTTKAKPVVASHGVKIVGKAKVGSTLTAKASPSKWTKGAKLTYTWTANGKTVKKSTAATLKVAKAWAGKKIKVTVKGTKSGYTSASRSSTATAKVVKSVTAKKR